MTRMSELSVIGDESTGPGVEDDDLFPMSPRPSRAARPSRGEGVLAIEEPARGRDEPRDARYFSSTSFGDSRTTRATAS